MPPINQPYNLSSTRPVGFEEGAVPTRPASAPENVPFGEGKVSSMRVFVFGMIVSVIVPFFGVLYALVFGFDRATRKGALIVLFWSILIAVVAFSLNMYVRSMTGA